MALRTLFLPLSMSLLLGACCRRPEQLPNQDPAPSTTANQAKKAANRTTAPKKPQANVTAAKPPAPKPVQAAPTATPAPRPVQAAPVAPPPQPVQAAPQPAPRPAAPSFRMVQESEWVPVVGPRLRPGSKVVSNVWRGPFGATSDGYFALYSRNEELFAVLVENGKSYHTVALGSQPMTILSKVQGMEILDVNNDGRQEVLVMASYQSGAGRIRADFPGNAVVGWTGATLSKIENWTRQVEEANSFQQARLKLGLSAGPVD